MENHSFSDVGGTPGGLGHFLIGVIMACLGGYFLANQVSVVGSFWSFFGANTFGITLVPLLFGIALLFWNGRSAAGWFLTVAVRPLLPPRGPPHKRRCPRPPPPLQPPLLLVVLVGGLRRVP